MSNMPDEMLLSSLSSIPNDKCGNICDSNNYRGNSLSTSLSKIDDLVILNKYKTNLCTSHMQYAFKGQHGTTMYTLAMKETIKYYLRNGSDVYMCLIDASKAFDRVHHDMLFQLLIERGIPAGVLRTLLDSYEKQRLRTVWNDCSSEIFKTKNGIK